MSGGFTPFHEILRARRVDGSRLRFDVPADWQQGRTAYGGLASAMAAQAILDCYLNPQVWNAQLGYLHDRFCWLDPAPWYQGGYPDARVAQLKLYDAVNSVCLGPQPGWPIYESEVSMTRILFFPLALPRNGFEEP